METHKTKTLEDFPKFVVTAVRPGATSDNGYQSFEIEGDYDPILEKSFTQISEGIGVQWFWLLVGENDCLCPTLESFDKGAKTAILSCLEKKVPKLIGLELAYLSPYWQAFHIWMVLDPNWGWEKKQFLAIDALAENFEAQDVSIVGGREVKVWTKLKPARNRAQSRHYPADSETSPGDSGVRIIPGGWDHEHCELCNKHIDAGMFGYCDRDERWMCENCYERYVMRRDLAFVDEL